MPRPRRTRRNRRRQNVYPRNASFPRRNPFNNTPRFLLPRETPQIVPPQLVTTLSFQKSENITNIGQNFVSVSYRPNGVYDIDPTVGSAAVPGFAEMMTLYNYYRVLSYRYELEVVSEEDFAITVYVLNTNVNPPAPTSFPQYAMNPLCQTKILGNRWGDSKIRFVKTIALPSLVGSRECLYDSTYRGTSSTNPPDLVWLALGVQSLGATLTALGVSYSLKLSMTVQFTDRTILTA
jgi:hypothetical protein